MNIELNSGTVSSTDGSINENNYQLDQFVTKLREFQWKINLTVVKNEKPKKKLTFNSVKNVVFF